MFFFDEDRKLLNDMARNYESLINRLMAQHDQIAVLIDLLKKKEVNICVKPEEKKAVKKAK